jgi:predicted dehydrogenase
MAKVKYNAVVVGSGSIGATKPDKFDSPKTKNVLTIAHAFYKHPQIDLIGIVDTDQLKCRKAANKWKTMAYQSIHQIGKPIDIMALCIPTEYHYNFIFDHFNGASCKVPKILLAEKPFCNSYDEAVKAKAILERKNIRCSIDYIRRYDTSIQLLREKIYNGNVGEIYSCIVHYDRGLVRDGCHAIDLCNYLFGKFIGGEILPGRRVNDYDDKDLTYPVHMVYENCGNVFMVPGNGEAFSIFEIDITGERGRYRLVDHGLKIETYQVEKEKTYGTYNAMSIDYIEPREKTELPKALMNYVDIAVRFMPIKEDLLCTPDDAIEVHRIIEKLIKGVYL